MATIGASNPNYDVYNSYSCNITQSGENNPQITETSNELGVNFSITREGVGVYVLSADGNFLPSDNLVVRYNLKNLPEKTQLDVMYLSENEIKLRLRDFGCCYLDGFNISFDLKVYPNRMDPEDLANEDLPLITSELSIIAQ